MIYLILLVSAVLRIISINQSLWLDEATSALVARMSLTDMFAKFLPGDFHPPLYYLILKYWSFAFGSSETGLRSLSVAIGVATVYLVYKKWGSLPAALLATSPLHIYYSQEARMYALAAFLTVFSIFSFVKIVKDDRVGSWIAFSLSLFLLGASDYVALFILPVFWIWGILSKKNINWFRKLFMSHIILLVFFALWSPIFIKQLVAGLTVPSTLPLWQSVLGSASLKNILLIPVKFAVGRVGFDNNLVYALIAVPVIALYGALIFKALRKSKEVGLEALWLIVPVAVGILVSLKISILSYFRFIFVLPAFYILASAGIEKFARHKKALTVLAVGFNVIFSLFYLFNPKFHREDWRVASGTIKDETIVFPASSQAEALIYYGLGNNIKKVAELDSRDRKIWLSRYVYEIVDSSDSTREALEKLGYNKTSEYNFNGVVFWKYMK